MLCFLSLARAQQSPNLLWQSQSIYQIVTDRFYDGDPANNNADGNYDPSGHRGTSVHGGDFKGVEQKLDYIKALGATAIWLSPIVLNARGEFHGYAGVDFYKVDPHWGTLEELQHLVRTAHARGILVIDDIVVNHGGNLIDSSEKGYPHFRYPPGAYGLEFRDPTKQYPPPFNLNPGNPALSNLFHQQGFIENYADTTQVELGELSGLDDFRTESPYVREQMAKIYEYWIEQVGFDAFRIDTVKHVEMGFWQNWCPVIHEFAATHGKPNFFMFGEVLDGSDAKCASYVGTAGSGPFKLDSVLDYPLYFSVGRVFAEATQAPAKLAKHYQAAAASYPSVFQNQLVTFLDNHDQPRFLSHRGASVERLKVALVFLYTGRGIPNLYYGTEQAFNGAKDPWDREDMFAGKFEWGPSRGDNFDMCHPLFEFVARLNNLRRLYPALQNGEESILWANATGPGLFAYTRRLGSQEILVVLNTADTPQSLPSCTVAYAGGTTLQNLLDENEDVTISPDGRTPPMLIAPAAARIFLPKSEVHALDPVVTSISPAHDSTTESPVGLVRIHFSKAMDTGSVEQAFSITPPAKGIFSWSANGDFLTFTPQGAGFTVGTIVTIRIADSARDSSFRKQLYAPFESRFRVK